MACQVLLKQFPSGFDFWLTFHRSCLVVESKQQRETEKENHRQSSIQPLPKGLKPTTQRRLQSKQPNRFTFPLIHSSFFDASNTSKCTKQIAHEAYTAIEGFAIATPGDNVREYSTRTPYTNNRKIIEFNRNIILMHLPSNALGSHPPEAYNAMSKMLFPLIREKKYFFNTLQTINIVLPFDFAKPSELHTVETLFEYASLLPHLREFFVHLQWLNTTCDEAITTSSDETSSTEGVDSEGKEPCLEIIKSDHPQLLTIPFPSIEEMQLAAYEQFAFGDGEDKNMLIPDAFFTHFLRKTATLRHLVLRGKFFLCVHFTHASSFLFSFRNAPRRVPQVPVRKPKDYYLNPFFPTLKLTYSRSMFKFQSLIGRKNSLRNVLLWEIAIPLHHFL